jgi:lipocalin
MDSFEEWWDNYPIPMFYELNADDMEAAYNAGYEAGVQSQQTELQNRITELEEIIIGGEDMRSAK